MFRADMPGPLGSRYEMARAICRRWLSADFEPLGRDHIVNEVRASEHSFLGL
jgi:hypothetical protein